VIGAVAAVRSPDSIAAPRWRRRMAAAIALAMALAAAGCGGKSAPPPASSGDTAAESGAATDSSEPAPADSAREGDSPAGDSTAAAAAPDAGAAPVPAGDSTAAAEPAPPADAGGPAPGGCADATSQMQDELMPRWDACYGKAPKKNRVPGKAMVEVRVDDTGNIVAVEYRGSAAFGKRASRCMVAATKATRFAAPACAGRTLTIQKSYGPGATR
jgi:hypothetical protein